MRNRDRTPPTDPYRPPAQDEQELRQKVCPDCIADPDHHSEGGLRPVAEFRLITGKAAARYAGGKRLAAYCRYHENKRSRERAAKREAAKREAAKNPANKDIQTAPKARVRRRPPAAVLAKEKKRRAYRLKHDPAYREHVREVSSARSRRWEAAHAEERRIYKARWFQDKLDAEIAAGKRPPRKVVRLRTAIPGRPPPDTDETES